MAVDMASQEETPEEPELLMGASRHVHEAPRPTSAKSDDDPHRQLHLELELLSCLLLGHPA